jgi:hypothetical protein
MIRLETLYTQLDTDKDEIRLAELASAGNYSDELVVYLRTTPIRTKDVVYDAVSYVWGEESAPCTALVNGVAVLIRSNLDCALRHLRNKRGVARVLWIDALCINQSDDIEKMHQIQMMGSIYSLASMVVVWLGAEDADTAFAFNHVIRNYIPTAPQDRHIVVRFLKGFVGILKLPWFSRVWVVQEIVLANAPVVHLGRAKVPWDRFCSFISDVAAQIDTFEKQSNESPWPRIDCLWVGSFSDRPRILDVLKKGGRRGGFFSRVHATMSHVATDPRDKVYALLGICDISPSYAILPDYSKSVLYVYTVSSTLFIQEQCPYVIVPLHRQSRLEPDYPFGPISEPSSESLVGGIPGLPSWAFDLTLTSTTQEGQHPNICSSPSVFVPNDMLRRIYVVSSLNFSPIVRFSRDYSTMFVAGEHIGTVVTTFTDIAHFETDNAVSPHFATYDFYNNVLRPKNITPTYFQRAFDPNNRLSIQAWQEFHILCEKGAPYWEQTSLDTRKLLRAEMGSRPRGIIIFLTKEGHIGSTYHPDKDGIQVGDKVVGLFGLNIPFVLRSVPQEARKGESPLEPRFRMQNIAQLVNHLWTGPDDPSDLLLSQHREKIEEYMII